MIRKTRNKFEETTKRQLQRSKVEFSYESDRIPYVIQGVYIPDFTIKCDRSGSWYLECKGYFRRADKRKLVAVKKCNPSLDIRILFYARSDRDCKWADKHGFPWAVSSIPKEWLTCTPQQRSLSSSE